MAKQGHGLKMVRPATAGKKIAELVWTAVLGVAATANAAQRPAAENEQPGPQADQEKLDIAVVAALAAEAAPPVALADELPDDIARLLQAAVQDTDANIAGPVTGDEMVAGPSLSMPLSSGQAGLDVAQVGEPVYVAAADSGTLSDAGPGADWSNAMLLAQSGGTGGTGGTASAPLGEADAGGFAPLDMDMNLLGFLGVGAAALVVDRNMKVSTETSGTPTLSSVSGTVVDGYVAGAKVFLDTNGNGVLDDGDTAAGTTDDKGNFQISGSFTQGTKVFVQGGVNNGVGDGNAKLTSLNVELQGVVDADGQIVVSPLTTLLATSGMSEAALKTALGIPEGVDLLSYDPVSALSGTDSSTAEHVFASAQQIMTLLQTSVAAGVSLETAAQTIGSALTGGSLESATQAIVSTIGQANPAYATSAAQTQLLDSLENINAQIATSYSGLSEALGNPTAMAGALAVTTVAQNEFLDAVAAGTGLQQFTPDSGPGFAQLVTKATNDIINDVQSLDASVLSDLLASGMNLGDEKISIIINDSGDAALLSSLLTTLGTQGADLSGFKVDSSLGDFQQTILDSLTSAGFDPNSVPVGYGDY